MKTNVTLLKLCEITSRENMHFFNKNSANDLIPNYNGAKNCSGRVHLHLAMLYKWCIIVNTSVLGYERFPKFLQCQGLYC